MGILMSRLELRLLDPLEVILDGEQVTGFESNKVRLFLAYLAVEAGRPQPREKLASLLWPDWPQKSALSNLRYALSDLRKNIGDRLAEPPLLNISRESLQFNLRSNCWVNASELERLQSKGIKFDTERLDCLVRSYRGPFLDGFSVEDSPEYEDWVRTKSVYFHRLILQTLVTLSEQQTQNGAYDLALRHAQRAIEIELWHKPAQLIVMHLLASARLGGYPGDGRAPAGARLSGSGRVVLGDHRF